MKKTADVLVEILKLSTHADIQNWLNDNLKELGEGSSRIVYEINNDLVIKFQFAPLIKSLPYDYEGPHDIYDQNRQEVNLSERFPELVAQVVHKADNCSWIICERADKVFYPELEEFEEHCNNVAHQLGTYEMEFGRLSNGSIVAIDYGF